MSGLQGETALVTGGARRIGAAIVGALAAAGAGVVIHHRDSKPEAAALAKSVTANGGQAWTVRGDLAKAKDRGRLLAESHETAGAPITLLVNNASSFPESKVSNLSLEDLNDAIEVNAWAPFTLTRTFAERLPQGRRGAVVNLVDARIADYDWGHVGYWLAKRMLADLTRLSAIEFAPRITVNGVCPGAVLGPSTKTMTAQEEKTFLDRMAKHVPLQSTPTPQDIAAAVVHLLSSPHTTGTFVEVDGGRHLGRAVYG